MRPLGAAERDRGSGGGIARAAGCLLLLALAATATPALAASAAEFPGMDLTTPTLQSLHRLQDGWQQWSAAYHRDDEEGATAAVAELKSVTRHLGMQALPDLAMAAAAYAVEAAKSGNLERARWALEAAEALDPSRPEVDFAGAAVARATGNYPQAFSRTVAGYAAVLGLPIEREILVYDLLLWLVFLVTLGGGLFVLVQMAVKGPALVHDMARLLGPRLPLPLRWLGVAALLLWPLLLPTGLVWLLFLWSVMLWGYAALSERVVLGVLWILLGVMPLGLEALHSRVEATLSPGRRAAESLAAGQLHGSLFSDMAVLHAQIGEETAFQEILADLHRRLGQWEYARTLYAELAEVEASAGHAAAALVNLGVYHHRKGDYGTAVTFFESATEADPDRALAYFDLSQALSQAYRFDESNAALTQAKELDASGVDRWLELSGQEAADAVLPVDGARSRIGEVRDQLRTLAAESTGDSPLEGRRRLLPLFLALGAQLLAVVFDLLRRQLRRDSLEDYDPTGDLEVSRWAAVAVPGLFSATRGRGLRGLVAILVPLAVVLLPLMARLGLRLPIGFTPWTAVTWTLAIVALVAVYGLRFVAVAGAER